MSAQRLPPGVEIAGPPVAAASEVLSPEALLFVAGLVRRFRPALLALLDRRAAVAAAVQAGARFDFLPETAEIRAADWRVAPPPPDLADRRVEITGPTDRKMVINALNSGARVYMADFEDSNAPTWHNQVTGQKNLIDAVNRTITFQGGGRTYRLAERTAVLMVRPRGLHLPEAHLRVDGQPAPGCLVDLGLFLFHNAAALVAAGTGPYAYLPKLESHEEAAWWDEVLVHAEGALGLPRGGVRVTVLIETLPAAFQMHEILHALRQRCVGLNCGRWDYIFSFIKKNIHDPRCLMPDRAAITMEQPFLRAYAGLLVQTCHRRGAHAMGGMAAQIPVKGDAEANAGAFARVRADKEREVALGHDGTWVAHPGLVPVAMEVFDAGMPGPNQVHRLREDLRIAAADLLAVPAGPRTEAGLRRNIAVSVQYLEAWLRGEGCVPLYNLMEDAATAEISRAQIAQWLRHAATLDDGTVFTRARLRRLLDEELDALRASLPPDAWATRRFPEARALFEEVCTAEPFIEFLTLPAYQRLCEEA